MGRAMSSRFRLVLPRFDPSLARRQLAPLLWWAGAAGLVALVFLVSFVVAFRVELRGDQIDVPDLQGKTFEEAAADAAPLGLNLQIVDERHDPATPSGRILVQDPPPGTDVKRGRKIKLIVSLGGKVMEVPDVVGHASRAVAIELRQAGFIAGDAVEVPADSEAGTILAQVPPAGTPAVPNTRVYRLVSAGPPDATWVMPDLIGRDVSAVEGKLRAAGFRLAVRRVPDPTRPRGTIVGQLPRAGYPVRTSGVVEVTIAD